MQKQLSRYSLKYRIAAIIFILELIMMAAVLSVTLSHSLETSQQHLTESENVLLDLLGDLSRIALITSEYDELQPYIEQVIAVPHVNNVFLANDDKRIVVSSDVTDIGQKLTKSTNSKNTIWRQKTIANATGEIGTLAIEFSHQDLIEANQDSLNLGIQIALSGMAFIALVGIAIGYLLTRRLESLAVSAQRIAEGDLEVRTNLKGRDEVAIVGQAFDHMAENIKTYVDNLIDSEEELRNAHNELEKRVEERTHQLAIATDEAIRANQSKSTFLANISHEIRTPLTAIIGFSDSLRDKSISSEDRDDAITTINESGKHLLRIINDILDLSKVEAGKLGVEKIEVSPFEIIKEVKGIAQYQAGIKDLYFNLEYQFPLPEKITSDPVRIKQILLNLCGNAIKFTSLGGVNLKISCDCKNELMTFKVIDTGIGLNDNQKEKIFNAFEQADSTTTRKYGGTGLGLSLSRSLAELLGGTITVSSTPEVGSCFTLQVATGKIDSSKLVHKPEDQPDLVDDHKNIVEKRVSGTVLLAEDNNANQKLIKMYLNRAGADVAVANNGQEALDMASTGNYDLILMDIHMPVMSGIDAVKLLRARGYKKPIAALTANAMEDGIKSCLEAGCDTFLSKPIDIDEFCSVLNNYLGTATEEVNNIAPFPTKKIQEANQDMSQPDDSAIISTLANEADGIFDALIEEFVETLPDTLKSIRQAYAQEYWETLADEVHTLKGTGGNFGYEQITETCRNLEKAIKNKNNAEIESFISELEALHTRINIGLKRA